MLSEALAGVAFVLRIKYSLLLYINRQQAGDFFRISQTSFLPGFPVVGHIVVMGLILLAPLVEAFHPGQINCFLQAVFPFDRQRMAGSDGLMDAIPKGLIVFQWFQPYIIFFGMGLEITVVAQL